jgi:hypothetical protein
VYKRVFLTTLITLAVAAAASVGGPNSFDGRWMLDKKAGNSSTAPMLDDLRQNIKASGSNISIDSTFKEPPNGVAPLLYLGIMVTNVQLNSSGSETINQIGPFMQTSKTTIDGNKMDTEWVAKHTSGEVVKGHWTRTLSDDGKHMKLEIKESSTKGQSGTATLNFVKK